MYTIDHFINKFQRIAENFWCTDVQFGSNGQRCAFGHCNAYIGERSIESSALAGISKSHETLLAVTFCGPDDFRANGLIANANNGYLLEYQQPTPKQRVIAILRDIKKLQQPEVKEVKTVYVTVDEKVREIQKAELCNN